MRKHALIKDNVVVAIEMLDAEGYAAKIGSYQIIIDIEDLSPQPGLAWTLQGSALVAPTGANRRVAFKTFSQCPIGFRPPNVQGTWPWQSMFVEESMRGELVSAGWTVLTEAEYTALCQSTGYQTADLPLAINARGEQIIESTLRVGKPGTKGMSILTPILTDKTTWYQRSVKATNQVLTDSGSQLEYSGLAPWINIRHPKLTYSEFSIPLRTGGFAEHAEYDVVVKKNGTTVTTGFTIDYRLGKVVFSAPLDPADVVTATFYHLNGVTRPSEWILTPPPGFKYLIEHVELQFEKNVGAFQDVIRFEVWANPGFTTGSPKGMNIAAYDATGWIEPYFGKSWPNGPTAMGQFRARYRNMADIVNAANEGKGTIPSCAELTEEIVVIPFNYLQALTLDSKMGTLFRMRTEQDSELSSVIGSLATATFYIQLSPTEK